MTTTIEQGQSTGSTSQPISREWNWHPDLPIPNSPVFAWPPRPKEAIRWLASYWLAVSMIVLEVITACVVWYTLQPDPLRVAAFDPVAIGLMYVRNLLLMSLIAGGLHLYLHAYRRQGSERQFDPRDLSRSNRRFTFNHQVWDNIFWTCASGVTLWTAFEGLYMWAYGRGLVPLVTIASNPVWFVAWFVLIPIWSSMHFYWIHRLLHWPPLYRLAHSVHHRNVVIGPWSGISMHPVEHFLYFTAVLIHFVVASHPVHFFFHMHLQTLNPAASHSGFDGLMSKGQKQMDLGDFFHQLHHRYFECNYGTAEMPWDKWFGTFHDGTEKAQAHIKRRRAARHS